MLDSFFFNSQNGEISRSHGKTRQLTAQLQTYATGLMVHKRGYMINGSVSTHSQWEKKHTELQKSLFYLPFFGSKNAKNPIFRRDYPVLPYDI